MAGREREAPSHYSRPRTYLQLPAVQLPLWFDNVNLGCFWPARCPVSGVGARPPDAAWPAACLPAGTAGARAQAAESRLLPTAAAFKGARFNAGHLWPRCRANTSASCLISKYGQVFLGGEMTARICLNFLGSVSHSPAGLLYQYQKANPGQ